MVQSWWSFRLRNNFSGRSNGNDEAMSGKCYPHHTSDSCNYSDQNQNIKKKSCDLFTGNIIYSLRSEIHGPCSPSKDGHGPVQYKPCDCWTYLYKSGEVS